MVLLIPETGRIATGGVVVETGERMISSSLSESGRVARDITPVVGESFPAKRTMVA